MTVAPIARARTEISGDVENHGRHDPPVSRPHRSERSFTTATSP
jgi:hypothetical protein